RRDIFDYIELFYNPKRRHGHAGGVAPVEFEKQYFNRLESVY
ncbi:MAG TPA: IS3 family transposase, partial [Rhodocyclaceae bacterium]|nr:IS3 family transposase [Rhodocyclaceae bacterium]